MTFEQAIKVLAALEREQVRYVLIGSMAMAAQGIIRATQDVDLFIAPDPENVRRLKRALRAAFEDDSVEEITPEDLAGPYPVIRYSPPEGDFAIDLISRIGEAFAFDDLEADELVVEGVRVYVATPRTLFAMKRDTLRPQDKIDAEALREKFNLETEA